MCKQFTTETWSSHQNDQIFWNNQRKRMQLKMIMITINFWIFYWLLNMNNMQSLFLWCTSYRFCLSKSEIWIYFVKYWHLHVAIRKITLMTLSIQEHLACYSKRKKKGLSHKLLPKKLSAMCFFFFFFFFF